MAAMDTSYVGPLIHMPGITIGEIPPASASASELIPLITSLLQEAVHLLASAAPETDSLEKGSALWHSKGTKTTSVGKVVLSERVLSSKELDTAYVNASSPYKTPKPTQAETWACRVSTHADASQRGTASWAEFVNCIRDRHAETEDLFTPTCLGHRECITWSAASEVPAVEVGGHQWQVNALKAVEMKHKVPAPLNKRVFAVLQLMATVSGLQGEEEFVVISVPLRDFERDERALFTKESSVVIGSYASVERVRKLREAEESGKIEWVMAVASDAGGVLPLWVQTKVLPGEIAKDVPYFLEWKEKERKSSTSSSLGTAKDEAPAHKKKRGEINIGPIEGGAQLPPPGMSVGPDLGRIAM